MPRTCVPSLTFYPAYCFPASPTYNTWVKLTAGRFHGLQERHGFEGQNLYFSLNHPIQWVQVTGLVANFESNNWYWIFHIDDGSGALVEVVLPRNKLVDMPLANANQLITLVGPSTTGRTISGNDIDIKNIEIGCLVKVKGGIKEFRGEKQITLERLVVIQDTAAEVKFWEELCVTYKSTLAHPWTLTKNEQRRLCEDERRAVQSLEEKQERKRVRDHKRQEKEARRKASKSRNR